jgi:hypothetical protein
MTNGLFKYFPAEEDKLERFTNGQVYLTPPKYLNDPWDFLIRSEPHTEEEFRKEVSSFVPPEDALEFQRDANRPGTLEEEAREQMEGLSKRVGLVCLTETPLWPPCSFHRRNRPRRATRTESRIVASAKGLCMVPL